MKSVILLSALLLTGIPSLAAPAALIVYDDPNFPIRPTGILDIDLSSYGFGRVDVTFASNRVQAADSWDNVAAAYASAFAPDVYPNVPNSFQISHLIKREIVREFNNAGIVAISGFSISTNGFESHAKIDDQQLVIIPYGETSTGYEGTFATQNTTTLVWGTDDLVGNLINANASSSASSGNYFGVVSSATVPEPSTFVITLVLAIIAVVFSGLRRSIGLGVGAFGFRVKCAILIAVIVGSSARIQLALA